MFDSKRIDALGKVNSCSEINALITLSEKLKTSLLSIYIWNRYYKGKPSQEDKKKYKKNYQEDYILIKSKSFIDTAIYRVKNEIHEYENETRIKPYRQSKLYTIEDLFSFLSLAFDKAISLPYVEEYKCSFEELRKYWIEWINLENRISEISNALMQED